MCFSFYTDMRGRWFKNRIYLSKLVNACQWRIFMKLNLACVDGYCHCSLPHWPIPSAANPEMVGGAHSCQEDSRPQWHWTKIVTASGAEESTRAECPEKLKSEPKRKECLDMLGRKVGVRKLDVIYASTIEGIWLAFVPRFVKQMFFREEQGIIKNLY